MQELINEIINIQKNRIPLLRSADKRKIGWLSIHTPIEIIHAADIIPFRITGETNTSTLKSSTLLHQTICSYILSCLEEAMDGTYDFMSGIVVVDSCNSRRRLFDVWKEYLNHEFKQCIYIPNYEGEFYKNFFRKQNYAFVESLQNHFSCDITEKSLLESIVLSNTIRKQLQILSIFHKNNPRIIGGVNLHNIIKSSTVGFRDDFIKKMSSLLERIKSIETSISSDFHRVLIFGSYFDHPEIIDTIEKAGGTVVCEDNSSGMKYFDGEIEVNSNPLDAISDYYFDKITSGCFYDTDKRLNYLNNKIEEYQIDSIIYISLKFCDPNLIDYPYIRHILNKKNIPVLYIESERHSENIESIKTRINSFFESIL